VGWGIDAFRIRPRLGWILTGGGRIPGVSAHEIIEARIDPKKQGLPDLLYRPA
jgi:hypothetical protein